MLAHKIREAMAAEVRTQPIGGDGKRAEIDGGYFGGYVKPANRRENPPTSEVMLPPSKPATTGRPSAATNPNKSEIQSFRIEASG